MFPATWWFLQFHRASNWFLQLNSSNHTVNFRETKSFQHLVYITTKDYLKKKKQSYSILHRHIASFCVLRDRDLCRFVTYDAAILYIVYRLLKYLMFDSRSFVLKLMCIELDPTERIAITKVQSIWDFLTLRYHDVTARNSSWLPKDFTLACVCALLRLQKK